MVSTARLAVVALLTFAAGTATYRFDPPDICSQCDCVGNNITCIGMIEPDRLETIPGWARELYIWECSVNRLARSSFVAAASNLRKLQVVEADLQSIDADAFVGMTNLEVLDLSRNPTRMGINPRILQDLVSLKYLNLSRIHHLDDFAILARTWFPAAIQLEEINLSHTYVRSLTENITFPHCKRLILKDLPIMYIEGDCLRLLDSPNTARIDTSTIEALDISGCGPIINEQFFDKFSSLRSLGATQATMNYTVLSKIGKTWNKLEYLNLSWVHLHGIPDSRLIWREVPSRLRVLDLSHDQIQEFAISKILGRLETLDLSFNRLERFETLRYMPNLVDLNLSDNQLTEIPYDASDGPDRQVTTKIRKLSLSNNRISLLVVEVFSSYPHLVSLNLRGNHIRFVNHKLFRLLPRLQQLDLTDNSLESFVFTSEISVKDLKLAMNDIDQLDIAESCCHKLEILSLERNVNLFKYAVSCPKHSKECHKKNDTLRLLERLQGLRVLDLSQTSLGVFPSHLVKTMPFLQYLSLSNNEITDTSLEQGLTMYNFTEVRIQFLNLSANRLTTFSPTVQNIFMQPWVAELDFSNNDYICSCDLAKAFDRYRYKLLRYFGFDGSSGRLYDCFSEKDSWTYSIREFMFLRRIRESCLPDFPGSRPGADSSIVVYVLLLICFTSVFVSLCYIGLARRRRRHAAKDTYTSVDYVILDSRPEIEYGGGHGPAISL